MQEEALYKCRWLLFEDPGHQAQLSTQGSSLLRRPFGVCAIASAVGWKSSVQGAHRTDTTDGGTHEEGSKILIADYGTHG